MRSLLVPFGLLAWLFAFTAIPPAQATEPKSQPNSVRPNILMIVSDDHAWTDYGFMGHPHLQTPHLDGLARESLTFPRGYVPSSLCCPSLASLLTGRYPHQHKITSNDPPLVPGLNGRAYQSSEAFLKGRQRMIEHMEAVPTLPRLLQEQGYVSLQTGKWWQGDYSHGGFTHGMTRGDRHGDDGLKIGRSTLQPIEDFLDTATDQNKPWMVWYAPMMPHDPHTPPQAYLDRTLPLTPSIHVARYWAMVEWFDETVGQLLETLQRRGLAENTIVVYVADNGWIQDPERPRYAPKSKQSPYDGGLRTPIMIRWPGTITPRKSNALASSIDILPTLLSAIGSPRPDDLPGIDLLSDTATAARQSLYGECFTHNANNLDVPRENLRWRWIVRDNWKLIVPNLAIEREGVEELYHLARDPTEENNVIASHPEIAQSLRRELDRWW